MKQDSLGDKGSDRPKAAPTFNTDPRKGPVGWSDETKSRYQVRLLDYEEGPVQFADS